MLKYLIRFIFTAFAVFLVDSCFSPTRFKLFSSTKMQEERRPHFIKSQITSPFQCCQIEKKISSLPSYPVRIFTLNKINNLIRFFRNIKTTSAINFDQNTPRLSRHFFFLSWTNAHDLFASMHKLFFYLQMIEYPMNMLDFQYSRLFFCFTILLTTINRTT